MLELYVGCHKLMNFILYYLVALYCDYWVELVIMAIVKSLWMWIELYELAMDWSCGGWNGGMLTKPSLYFFI